jgi:alpha/beta superfamily hydrolase
VAVVLSAAVALAACAGPAPIGPDREREARWRAEIAPALVVGEAVDLSVPGDAPFLGVYTPAAGARTGVVLVHGSGVHPDWGIVGALRMSLADRGYTTLSIQMPVRPAGVPYEQYVPLMPAAADRIAAAAAWLQARGLSDLVIVSHSMGSRMASAYFERNPAAPFRAWVSAGIVGGGYSPTLASRGKPRVLDIYGERDFPEVVRDAPLRAVSLRSVNGARQVRVDGADHFFAGREAQLVETIDAFLAAK